MAERKALVVDDEFHIVQVVAIKLRNNGFEVFTADNGSDAYRLACEHRPDVIVTDYQMPAMTGIELTEKLRQNSATVDIPVLLLTARGFAIDPQQKESLRVAACLSKPFSPREVLHCIEQILAQRAAV
jgi:two-component system alkaline phosphatase synthesis response regulator PhoP